MSTERTVTQDGKGNVVSITTKQKRGCFGNTVLWFALLFLIVWPATWEYPWNVVAYGFLGLLIVGGFAHQVMISRPAQPLATAPQPPEWDYWGGSNDPRAS